MRDLAEEGETIVACVGDSIHRMKYEVGRTITVKLSGGRIVKTEIKAIRETTEGVRLQVSFANETALIYEWQIVEAK